MIVMEREVFTGILNRTSFKRPVVQKSLRVTIPKNLASYKNNRKIEYSSELIS